MPLNHLCFVINVVGPELLGNTDCLN